METLIVLAVISILFVAVVGTLGGRQGKNQFTQAINNVQTQIQQAITETQSGYYQNNGNFKCTSTGGTPTITTGANDQGTNAVGVSSGCVFLGKVLQFGVHGTDPEEFTAFSVAGFIGAKGTTPLAALQAAHPTPIYPVTGVNPSAPADNIINSRLLNGLTTKYVRYTSGATTKDVGAVAFLMELGTVDTANNYNSGSQTVDVIPVDGTSLGQTNAQTARFISQSNLTVLNPSAGVKMCFVSGSTNQSGLITIGSNGGTLTVTLQRKSNNTCT